MSLNESTLVMNTPQDAWTSVVSQIGKVKRRLEDLEAEVRQVEFDLATLNQQESVLRRDFLNSVIEESKKSG